MSDRKCTNCGKGLEDLPYELWLFHTCRHCAYEATPVRFSTSEVVESGTYRKWRYYPKWHMIHHPENDVRIERGNA